MSSGVYTEAELAQLAGEIADSLAGYETIFLSGELGAGKTTFTRHLVSALTDKELVSSPTFTLINEYPLENDHRIAHVDLYRLNNPDDVITLGLNEYLDDERTITVVEWPEIGDPYLARPNYHLHFEHRDPTTRTVTVTNHQDEE